MKACFIPKKGVDDTIGAKLQELDPTNNQWNMYTVAALRGAYSEVNQKPLDLEDINTDPAKLESVVKELVSFIHKEKQKNAKFVSSLSHTSGQKMFQLSKAFSGKDMFNRTNMIVSGVLSMVNRIQTQNPTLSTAQILTGIKVNDKKEYGLTQLLEALYNNFNAGVTVLRNKGEIEKAEKIEKVLQNWSSFLPFIKAELSDYTNLNISNNADVAVDAEIENLTEDIDWEQSVEELPKENFAVKKHEMSPFKTANEIVRMTLKLMPKKIQKMTPQGETIIENEVDDLGITVNMNPPEIYQSLIELVSLASTDTQIRDVLYNAYTNQNYYWLEPIINELFIPTNFNDTTVYTPQQINVFKRRLAFRSALFNSRAHYEHIGGATKTITEQGTIKRKTLILNKIENTVLKSTQANLAMGNQTHPTKSVYNSDKTTNIQNIKDFVETVETLFSVPKTEEKTTRILNSQGQKNVSAFDNQYTKNRAAQAHTIQDLAHRLGIPMSLQVATKIVFDTKKRNSIIKAFQNLAEYGFKARVNNNVIKADTKFINVANTFYAEERLKNLKTTIINENYAKIANIVSDVNANNKYENSARRKNSKNQSVRLFGYLKPSFLSKFVNNIKKFINVDDTNGLKKFFLDNYGQSSVFIEKFDNGSYRWLNTYIKDLLFPQDSFSEDDFASKLAIKRFVGQDGLDSADYTPLERALNHIEEFSFAENDENYAWYPVFTLGDSEVTKYIKAKIYTEDEIINGLYLTYLSEHRKWKVLEKAREKMAKENVAPLKEPFEKIGVYTLLQFLNKDYVAPNGQTNVYATIAESGSEQDVKKAIKQHLRDSFISTQQTYQQLGVYDKVVDMQGNVTNMYLHINHLGDNIDKINEVLYKQHINTKFSLTQQLQLFHTDPAFYKGSKDLQKRNKQVITGSKPLNLSAVDSNGELICPTGTENVIYIEDYISNSEIDNPAFAAAVKHNLGNTTAPASYKKNNATDGGGFRSLDSYRMIRRMATEWTEEDEMAYSIIKNIVSKYDENSEMSEQDVIAVQELSQVFQALKPFYFGPEFYAIDENEKLMFGVQQKYAETILIPQLLPIGSKLRTVGFAMENHVDKDGNPQPIDLVVFTSAVKTGEFGAVNLDYKTGTEEPADVDDVKSQFNTFGYVHQLNLDNYMLVTNVPVHNDTAHANFATQIRKLVMAGVNKTKDYSHYMKGKIPLLYRRGKKSSFNGEDLINFYNELIIANMVETFNEVNTLLQDKSKLSESFIANVINNARESKDNILAYSLWEINGDVRFLMPLFGGMLAHDAQAALLSIYKKKVNKQKIQGGSYVQASAWGINKIGESPALQEITDADFIIDKNGKKIIDPSTATNVLYTECQIPFELSYKKPNGQVVNLVQSDWCNADGTLKLDTKNEIKKDDPRYKDYQSFVDAEGKVRQPLIDKQFPGILDFVAYRIPTEGSYSMLKLKAVRFSTKIEGGIIKVPFEGTTIAGFDFDIDKLFFMRKEFLQKNLTKDQIRDIWQGIYKEHPEIKQALLEAKSDAIKGEALVSKIFNIFNNSDLAKKIVNVEEEVKSLNKYWAEAGLEGTAKQVFDDYIKQHPYKYMAFEEYNDNVLPMHNNKAVRNNALLEIIQNRLQDPETFNARFTPGGFPNASNAARMLREIIFSNPSDITENGVLSFNKIQTRAKDKSLDPEPNYDPTLITTILLYDELNAIASKLIGVFANHNTNHSLAGMMEEFSLLNPILFGEMVGAVLNIQANDAKHQVGESLLGKKITLSNGQEIFIDTTMAEFLAAAVDAVKDPVLNYLNLNTVTANAGALLGRLGYSFLDIGLILNQPIVKEICREVLNNNITIEQAAVVVGDKYAKIFNDKKYLDISSAFMYNKENPQFYTSQELGQSILEHRLKTEKQAPISKNMAEQQLRVLGLFLDIQANASALNDFVVNTKFTSENAVKSTMGGMYNQQQKLELYVEQQSKPDKLIKVKVNNKVALPMLPSRAFDDYAIDTEEFQEQFAGHPFAYEQMMAYLNYKFIKSLDKILPYETAFFKGVRQSTQQLMNKAVPANVIDRAHEKAIEYLLKIQENSLFNPETTVDRINEKGVIERMTTKEYYLNRFPQIFLDMVSKSDELKKFDIIQAIVPEVREGDVEKLDLIVPQIGNLDKKHGIDILKSSWKDLHSNPKFRSLSFDLFFYNFYKVGFSFNPQGFMSLVPVEVELDLQLKSLDQANNISYIEFLNKILDGKQHQFTNPSNFLKYFVVNNLDLGIFTYKASGDIKKVLKDKMFVGPAKDILVESITISKKELQDQKFDFEKIFFDVVEEGEDTYVKTKPIIQVDNTYFVANNIKSEERGRLFNYVKEEGGDVVARYSRIDITSLTLATKEALLPTEELVEIAGNKNVLQKLTQLEQNRFDKYMEALQAIFKKDTIFDISGMEGQLKQIFINSLANKSSEYEMQSALIQKVQEILANNKETIVMDSEGERTSSC